MYQLYVQHKHQVRSILSQLLCNQPAYHNLEWRLDVQVRRVMSAALSCSISETSQLKVKSGTHPQLKETGWSSLREHISAYLLLNE